MSVPLPGFILGYHGCDLDTADRVISGGTALKDSRNDYDWLGDGIYFWEHNPRRAFEFAREMAERPHPSGQRIKSLTVVGAIIDLGFCLNLLDSESIRIVQQAYKKLLTTFQDSGLTLPVNIGGPDRIVRKLDCAVLQMVHQIRVDSHKRPFDSVRAVFMEGNPLYTDAGFSEKNHIQVCVRNHACIKGYFRPIDESGKPITFT